NLFGPLRDACRDRGVGAAAREDAGGQAGHDAVVVNGPCAARKAEREREGERMSEVGQKEKLTQQRVLNFLKEPLGYRYLGNWDERGGENVEEPLLRAWLLKRGYDAKLVDKAIDQLARAKHVGGVRSLYD